MEMTQKANLKLETAVQTDSLLPFYRAIAALLDSGRNCSDAFGIAGKSSGDPALQDAAYGVCIGLEKGKTLGNALKDYPLVFNELNKSLIETGEKIGALSKVFPKIAEAEEALDITRHRIRNALTYPTIVVFGILIIMTVLPRLFVPAVRDFTRDLGLTMPAYSKLIFAFSDITVSPVFWVVVIVAIAVIAPQWSNVFRSGPIRRRLLALCYRIPALSVVLKAVMQAHWARILSLHLEAGSPITKALDTLTSSSEDPVFKKACQSMYYSLESGNTIAEAVAQTQYFDPLVMGMVAVGEESGCLPRLLDLVTKTYEDEFAMRVNIFEQLLTPVLMLICGVIVGGWMVAILLPLGQIITNLGI